MKEQTEIYGKKIGLEAKYRDYFLEYASYVILDRAVPSLEDGLKPVQRRILHSLWEMDDGRYNKVANVVGHAMRYHPHGDASIQDALVAIGQKDLLIDCQGNWGNLFTGDPAAAGRYIEARLTPFALTHLFSPRITNWLPSYDGRGKEPKFLPVKFPLLLALGAEGIAVGLSTKILPHNPIEICECAIKYLKNETFQLLPDFPTGGMADFAEYNDGKSGSKVKIRAHIEVLNAKTLQITEIPFESTTQSLVDSILNAQEKGKVKVRKVEDNTAESVNILVHINPGEDPVKTRDALFAFTDCEKTLFPSSCVIYKEQPIFPTVSEILAHTVDHTKELLLAELSLERNDTLEEIFALCLEIIFVQSKVYRKIEDCESYETAATTVISGIMPELQKLNLHRELNKADIDKLFELKIRRIAKFDLDKSQKQIEALRKKLRIIEKDMKNIVATAITHFEKCIVDLRKANAGLRKTQISPQKWDLINKAEVAATKVKVFLDATEGFIGTSPRITANAVFAFETSDSHKVFCITEDGFCKLLPLREKSFARKGILLASPWIKNDETTVYTIIYREGGRDAPLKLKRFLATSLIQEKDYPLGKPTHAEQPGDKGIQVLFAKQNKLGEHPGKALIKFAVKHRQSLDKIEIDLASAEVKPRTAQGQPITAKGLEATQIATLDMTGSLEATPT